MDCLAENNYATAGYRIDGLNNRATLINCRSIGNKDGYYVASNAYMKLIDCTSKNNVNIKNGAPGHITIENTELVV